MLFGVKVEGGYIYGKYGLKVLGGMFLGVKRLKDFFESRN